MLRQGRDRLRQVARSVCVRVGSSSLLLTDLAAARNFERFGSDLGGSGGFDLWLATADSCWTSAPFGHRTDQSLVLIRPATPEAGRRTLRVRVAIGDGPRSGPDQGAQAPVDCAGQCRGAASGGIHAAGEVEKSRD